SSSHLGGSVEHGADDLVIAGAAAEIAGQPVAHFRLARVGLPVEQRLRSDQEAGRADPALQRSVLQELALQRVQLLAACHALDGADRLAVRLDAQHQARADEAPIDGDAAGAAIAGGASLLGAGEPQLVAQDVEQRLLRLAEELHLVPVHRRRYVVLRHQLFLARSSAICAARRASTPATLIRKSLVPRLSSIGRQAALAAAASFCMAPSSTLVPTNAAAAAGTSRGRSATAPSAMRAAVHLPLASSVRQTPQPTTAMSISVRGMNRRYASPVCAGLGGSRKEAMISPLVSDSLRGPIITSSTGISLRPFGPKTEAFAPAAIRAGTLSAAGEPLHRLPPIVARPWICVEPIRLAASTTPGQTDLSFGCSLSSAPVTAAPIRNPPASSLTCRVSGIPLMSTSSTGSTRSVFICTSRSVPPASTRASPLALASSATAWSSELGAS